MKDLISDLVLDVSIEVFVPLCYLVTFLSAYYGPNADILGNIGNSYWKFEAVEGVTDVVSLELQMAAIDFAIFVATGIILWILCRINLIKELCKLMKTYWAWIGIRLAMILFIVSKKD